MILLITGNIGWDRDDRISGGMEMTGNIGWDGDDRNIQWDGDDREYRLG